MVVDFALMPGDRCSESELAERLGISRTPLRQGLQRLEREGFLNVLPKIGWPVAPLELDRFDELYGLRVLFDCHAVRLLAHGEEESRAAPL